MGKQLKNGGCVNVYIHECIHIKCNYSLLICDPLGVTFVLLFTYFTFKESNTVNIFYNLGKCHIYFII